MDLPGPEEDTVEFLSTEEFSDTFFDPTSHRLSFEFGAATHAGNVRPINEDHYAIVRRRRFSEIIHSSLTSAELLLADDSAYAMIVADGMGGQRFGEFASRLALKTMFELAQQATSWVTRFTDTEAQQIRDRVDAYVQRIQETLRDYIAVDPALAGMGTTWTSAHFLPPHVLVIHIGDSRAYLMHNGKLRQVTHDETVAQAFVDSGMDPASVTRFRHLLLNSFGGDSEKVTATIHHLDIEAGDYVLLCTDGLTDMIADDEIEQILQKANSPQQASDRLVAAALDNGGKDNVTVAVASVE